jgi:hypothetical protein
MTPRWSVRILPLAALMLAASACTSHRVQVDPIEVKPIHLTVDVNIKIDRELDQFFAFEEAPKAPAVPATAPATAPAPTTTAPAPGTGGAPL